MDKETKLVLRMMDLLCDHMSDAVPDHSHKFWPEWNSLVEEANGASLTINISEEILNAGLGQIYSHDLVHAVDQDY